MAGDRDEQWTKGGTNKSGDSGNETAKNEGKVVTWRDAVLKCNVSKQSEYEGRKTYPDRTNSESHHATLEPGLRAFLCDPLINALSQPNVRLHVPRIEQHLEVLGELNIEHPNISSTVPKRASLLVVPGEPKTSDDRGTLREKKC